MSRFTAWMNVALIATIVALLTPTTNQALAQADDDQNTEDILYLADGRILHGQIISETEDEVVFNITVNRKAKLFAKVTFSMDEIDSIERDVALEEQIDQEATKRNTRRSSTNSEDDDETDKRGFGRLRASSDAENIPSFYIVPMKGTMGTDITPSIYKKLVPDILEVDPAVIIIVMNSADYADTFAAVLGEINPSDIGRPEFDDYKEIVNIFHDDLGKYRQVVWVQDAVGIASTMALSWEELYMTPNARLGGMNMVIELTGADKWSDDDIRAKMMAAWMGSAKSLLEYGGYAYELSDAMMWAPNMLSASFKGREVVWSLDKAGEFVIDSDDERTANFRAEAAENLLISDGTPETLDDLALLLGFREYRVIDEEGKRVIDGYRKKWRTAYSDTISWWKDYGQYLGWATGEDTLQYLGKAKRMIERIIKAMDRYPTVAMKWQQERGVSKLQLEVLVEQLTQQIRALRQRGGGGGGGRRGGGGMGGG